MLLPGASPRRKRAAPAIVAVTPPRPALLWRLTMMPITVLPAPRRVPAGTRIVILVIILVFVVVMAAFGCAPAAALGVAAGAAAIAYDPRAATHAAG